MLMHRDVNSSGDLHYTHSHTCKTSMLTYMYSTDQWKGKRKPLRIRGMDASNPRMLVCGYADNGPDVRSQLRTRGHPPANPRR